MARQVLIAIVFLILLQGVFAIGFYLPDKNEFVFEPGKIITYTLGVKGPIGVPIVIDLEAGDLQEYVNISTKNLVLKPLEVHPLEVRIELPEALPHPGIYTVWVTATENPAGGSASVTARAAVRHKVQIVYPYDGQYPKAVLKLQNGQFDVPLHYGADIVNYGTETIGNVYADVAVFYRDLLAGSAKTNQVSLPFMKSAQLRTNMIIPNGTPGEYHVIVDVHADAWHESFEGDVLLGRPEIRVEDYTKTFLSDRVNEMRVTLLNIWDGKVEGKMNLRIEANGTVMSARNPEVILYPWEPSHHSMFFTTDETVPSGNYSGTLTLEFIDDLRLMPITVQFMSPKEALEAQEVNEEKPSPFPVWTITLFLLILVIILLSLLLVKTQRRKNE